MCSFLYLLQLLPHSATTPFVSNLSDSALQSINADTFVSFVDHLQQQHLNITTISSTLQHALLTNVTAGVATVSVADQLSSQRDLLHNLTALFSSSFSAAAAAANVLATIPSNSSVNTVAVNSTDMTSTTVPEAVFADGATTLTTWQVLEHTAAMSTVFEGHERFAFAGLGRCLSACLSVCCCCCCWNDRLLSCSSVWWLLL